jgi:mannose-6-phosphate isomerase-like protein (cupin superfamily)
MRLPIKTTWGNEIVLAEEEWMTLSELNFKNIARGTDYTSHPYEVLYYIDEGMAEVTIGGSTLQWGFGKSIRINPKVKHRITPISIPLRIIKVSHCKANIEKNLV